MRYLPKSPAERQEMLAAIGANPSTNCFPAFPNVFACAKR